MMLENIMRPLKEAFPSVRMDVTNNTAVIRPGPGLIETVAGWLVERNELGLDFPRDFTIEGTAGKKIREVSWYLYSARYHFEIRITVSIVPERVQLPSLGNYWSGFTTMEHYAARRYGLMISTSQNLMVCYLNPENHGSR